MLQESLDELLGGNRHHLLLLLVSVVFPLEGNLTIFQCQQTPIRDSYAMSVASQILQHLLRAAKGGLGVNHPVGIFQRRQITGERAALMARFRK